MVSRFILTYFLVLFIAIAAQGKDSCFPDQVIIKNTEEIDRVESLQVKQYFLEIKYPSECNQSLPERANVLVASMDQGLLETRVETKKRGRLDTATDTSPWNLRINASYFNKKGEPTLMLKNQGVDLGEKGSKSGGIFFCASGFCQLVSASSYKEDVSHNIVVQSTPRLINAGKYTKGVHGPNVFDQRIGLAIKKSGELLVFQSGHSSFNVLRRFLMTEFEVIDALALDGGSSTSFHTLTQDERGNVFEIDKTHYFWVGVPYYLNFKLKSTSLYSN